MEGGIGDNNFNGLQAHTHTPTVRSLQKDDFTRGLGRHDEHFSRGQLVPLSTAKQSSHYIQVKEGQRGTGWGTGGEGMFV